MSQQEIQNGGVKIPLMTSEEREQGARGFVVVTSLNPLPIGVAAYWCIVNEAAVISVYKERKNNGGGQTDMLAARNLATNTISAGIPLTPPKNNPIMELEVSSGSIICYLID